MNEHLIDANALLNEIVDFKHDAMNADDYNAYDVVEKAIRAMPTIDPETLRPVGHWEVGGVDPANNVVGNWVCSLCNETSLKKYPFCPNCGAKMED